MDPVALVLTALGAGALAGAGEAAKSSSRDAVVSLYKRLKNALIQRSDDPAGTEVVLRGHAADPTAWQEPTRLIIENSASAQDPVVQELATELLRAASRAGLAIDQKTVTITHSKAVVVGDGATMIITFNESSSDPAGDTKLS